MITFTHTQLPLHFNSIQLINAIPSIQTFPEPKPFNYLMKLIELSASAYLCVYKPMKCCYGYPVQRYIESLSVEISYRSTTLLCLRSRLMFPQNFGPANFNLSRMS